VFPGPDAVVEAKKARAKTASRGKSASAGGGAKGGSARKKSGK